MAKPPALISHWFLLFLLISAALAGCGRLAHDSNTPATSLQDFIAETKASPLHLAVPRDDDSARSATLEAPLASRLVVLIFGDSGIYAYMGNDINAGKQYTYKEFRKFLASKKKDASLVVIIRPSANTTYRCNVNMLDEMTIAGIKKYQLVDITKPEEEFLSRLKKNA